MASWSGDLFVFTDDEGQDYISAALPSGPASNVRRYSASGPSQLVSWPRAEKVDEATAWLAKKRAEGFEFQPVPL